jgi:hypothetical protein
VAKKGILSSPNVKPGKVLPVERAEMMEQFYVSDKISRIMTEQMIMFLLTQKARTFILISEDEP